MGGNPGCRYDGTRHNVGADAVEELARRADSSLSCTRYLSKFTQTVRADGTSSILARSETFMNGSGRAVEALCRAHQLPVGRLIVVHDELDLPPGRVKLKTGGGEAGHNGLRSIVKNLETTDFVRVRVGVGK